MHWLHVFHVGAIVPASMKMGLTSLSRHVLVGAVLCAVLAGPSAWTAHVDAVQRIKKIAQNNRSQTDGTKKKNHGQKHEAPSSSESSVAVIVAAVGGKSAEGKSSSFASPEAVCATSDVCETNGSAIGSIPFLTNPATLHEPVYRALAPPIHIS